MDLNHLTRDADDLIRKVVSRYNQLYVPAGNFSQVELDLMLDDLRRLYDTFKTIGQVNLTLQQNSKKPEVTVQSQPTTKLQSGSYPAAGNNENTAPKPEPQQQQQPAFESAEPAVSVSRDNTEPDPKPVSPMGLQPEPAAEPVAKLTEEAALKETTTEAEPDITAFLPKTEAPVENEKAIEAELPESHEALKHAVHKPIAEIKPGHTSTMLADRFSPVNKSLSETIAPTPENDVVGGRILFQPLADLTTGIGLNDKFNFISELFGNNPVQYEEAIGRINKAVNLDEANWILQKYHASDWDQKQDSLARMKDFIKRRFI